VEAVVHPISSVTPVTDLGASKWAQKAHPVTGVGGLATGIRKLAVPVVVQVK